MRVKPKVEKGCDLAEIVEAIVGTRGLCSIATVTPQGDPYIHTAFYARTDEGTLVFASSAGATHSQNLEGNPKCAIAIYPAGQSWDDWKRGIQGFGRAAAMANADMDSGWRAYKREYPEYDEWLEEAGAEAEQMRPELYEVRLDEIRILAEEVLGEEKIVAVEVC